MCLPENAGFPCIFLSRGENVRFGCVLGARVCAWVRVNLAQLCTAAEFHQISLFE